MVQDLRFIDYLGHSLYVKNNGPRINTFREGLKKDVIRYKVRSKLRFCQYIKKQKVVVKLKRPTMTFHYYDRLHINSLSHFSEPTPEATTNNEQGSYLSLIDSNLL
jgi:hypothetical protein